jgi:lipopolysaccharide export system protein LptC
VSAWSARPDAAVATRTTAQRLREQWDLLMRYLPVLLMGLLAMVTYWLVRHTPEPLPVQPDQPVRHVPDYFMRGFSLKVYAPDGRLEFRVQGDHAEHFPDTDRLEVEQPRLTKVDETGRVTDASARQAITTPDGQRVELKGQAVVRRAGEPGAQGSQAKAFELRSDYLFMDLDRDVMRTDRPVEVLRGGDRFTADAMDHDHERGVTRMSGRVRGVLQPRTAR